jgi:hypothetical protein
MPLASYFDIKPLHKEVGPCLHIVTQYYEEAGSLSINALYPRFAPSGVIDRLCYQDAEVSTKLLLGSVHTLQSLSYMVRT